MADRGECSDSERFWNAVGVAGENDCWLWKGSTFKSGYGQCYAEKKVQRSHRVAWKLTHGNIPPGLGVLHTCDNHPCCNPRHLFLGDQRDNMQDCSKKRRTGYGWGNGRKFTNGLVMFIRWSHLTNKQLSDLLGLSYPYVVELRIPSSRRWVHIPFPEVS